MKHGWKMNQRWPDLLIASAMNMDVFKGKQTQKKEMKQCKVNDSFPGTSTHNAPTTSLYILSYWHVDNMLHLVYQTITGYQFHLLSTDQHNKCRHVQTKKITTKPSCNRRPCLPRSGSAPVATLDASDTATPKLAMIEKRDEQNRSSLPSCSLPSVSLFMLFSHHHRHGRGTAKSCYRMRHRQF